MQEIIPACRSTNVNRQTVKLTPGSSGRNPTRPIYKLPSRKRPDRPHIPSDNSNVKKQRKQIRGAGAKLLTPIPVSHSQNFTEQPAPRPSVRPVAASRRFGEAVSRPQAEDPQEGKDRKVTLSRNIMNMNVFSATRAGTAPLDPRNARPRTARPGQARRRRNPRQTRQTQGQQRQNRPENRQRP